MSRLTSIAEKCLWALTGAAALALFTHFTDPQPEKLVVVTQTASVKENAINAESKTLQTEVSSPQHLPDSSIPSESTAIPQQNSGSPPKSDLVNINIATLEELMTLSGIGEVKAQAIIDYREQYGGFGSVNELLEVSGIGEKTLEKFRDDVTV